MSDTLNKRLELAAYVVIVILGLVSSAVLVKKFFLHGGPSDPHIAAGTKITVPGVEGAQSGDTLVLVLSTDCRYCTESADFYQRLAAEASKKGSVRLVALLPQPLSESRQYLERLRVPVGDTVQAPPDAVGAAATPTLILVDRTGVVKKSWVGKLPESAEKDVIARLAG